MGQAQIYNNILFGTHHKQLQKEMLEENDDDTGERKFTCTDEMTIWCHYMMMNIYIEAFYVIISIFSCVWYVLNTYGIPDVLLTYIIVESVFLLVFLSDYIICCIAYIPHTLDYVLSARGIVSFLAIIPSIVAYFEYRYSGETFTVVYGLSKSWLGFLRFARLLLLLEFVRIKKSMNTVNKSSELTNESALEVDEIVLTITRLIVNITTFIFLATGITFAMSALIPDAYDNSNGEIVNLTWFEAFYFTIVSITTVGYGDIVPVNTWARLVTIMIIIIAFTLIPNQIAHVVQVILHRSAYISDYTPRRSNNTSKHIVICGIVDYEFIYKIISELFDKSHSQPNHSNSKYDIVILSPTKPSVKVEGILNFSQFSKFIHYFIGSSKSSMDLERVKCSTAMAIYVIADVVTRSIRMEEDSIFLSSISIIKYIRQKNIVSSRIQSSTDNRSKPVVLVKLTSTAKPRHILTNCGVGVVIPVQELKNALIALGAIFPGFLSLFTNLNRARSFTQKRIAAKQHARHKWQPEYYQGTRHSIQQIEISTLTIGVASIIFKDAVVDVYNSSNGKVILVGLKYHDQVLINPKSIDILECTSIFVISQTVSAAVKAFQQMYSKELKVPGVEGEHLITAQPFTLMRSASSAKPIDCIGINTPTATSYSSKSAAPTLRTLSSFEHIFKCRSAAGKDSFYSSLSNHIVLIISSSTAATENSSNSLMMPVLHFLHTIRSYTRDTVIVLCDRAEELHSLSPHISRIKADIDVLDGVYFYSGSGRNYDHLNYCRVKHARCVLIIRSPYVCEGSDELKADPLAAMLNADRNSIITSLNLHSILGEATGISGSMAGSMVNHPPFTITELVHEANISFLRNPLEDTASIPYTPTDEMHDSHSDKINKGKAKQKQQQQEQHQQKQDEDFSHFFDWKLIAAGSIFSHSILDTLIVNCMFNKDVLSFWESITKTGYRGLCSSKKCTYDDEYKLLLSPCISLRNFSDAISEEDNYNDNDNDNDRDSGNSGNISDAGDIKLPNDTDDSATPPFTFEEIHDEDECKISGTRHSNIKNQDASDRCTTAKIRPMDKINLPVDFIGKTVREFFNALYLSHSSIMISIYRHNNSNDLPYVIVCPRRDMVLEANDEIFVFNATM